MSIIVSVRNADISDTLKNYAEKKADALIADYHKITSVRVILGSQKYRYKAEIIVRGKNINVEADYESYDLYDSIDAVIDKANTQLRRHLDKVQDHHKTAKMTETPELAESEKAEEVEETEKVEAQG